ncbi:hypothetical protein, partial [Francisella tularensis]|uniref:hypothetical protein n=1 Tax=Francisella tularensis TaxID=263 RepID=UPI002381B490
SVILSDILMFPRVISIESGPFRMTKAGFSVLCFIRVILLLIISNSLLLLLLTLNIAILPFYISFHILFQSNLHKLF